MGQTADQRLWMAMHATDLEAFDAALADGADFDAAGPMGSTILAWSIRQPDFLSHLIGAGAKVDTADSRGVTALHLAAEGHPESLEHLLAAGADALAMTGNRRLPLDYAILAGESALVDRLWQECRESPEAANRLLVAAAAWGRCDQLEAALAAGADPKWRGGFFHDPPLHLAAGRGYQEILEGLLAAGADRTVLDAYGNSAVVAAALRDQTSSLDLLFAHGFAAESKAVLRCAEEGVISSLMTLLRAGSPVEGQPSDRSPLQAAVEAAQLEAVEALIAAGADLESRERSRGRTPLLLALASDHEPTEIAALVACLRAAGADPEARDLEDRDAVEIALASGQHRAIEGWPKAPSDLLEPWREVEALVLVAPGRGTDGLELRVNDRRWPLWSGPDDNYWGPIDWRDHAERELLRAFRAMWLVDLLEEFPAGELELSRAVAGQWRRRRKRDPLERRFKPRQPTATKTQTDTRW